MIFYSFLLLLLLTADLIVVVQSQNIGTRICCFCDRSSFVAKRSVWLLTVELKPCNTCSSHYRRREWTSRTFLNQQGQAEQEEAEANHNDPVNNDKKKIEERSKWLRQRLGISQAQLERVVTTTPELLTLRSESLDRKFNWIQTRLDLTQQKQLTKLFMATSKSFMVNMPNNAGPKLDLIQNRIQCTNIELVKLLENSPRLMNKSIDKIVGVLDVLETQLNLNTTQDLRNFVLGGGTLLASSATILKPRIVWLQRTLQLIDDDCDSDDDVGDAAATKLGKLLKHHGNLLTFDVEKTLEPKVQWLKQRLNANDEEVAYLLRHRIQSLKLHMESTLESKFSWLMNRFELKDAVDLKRMLLALPAIVSYSHENIEPKIKFYVELLGDKQLANRFVATDPRYLSYSLEKRIKPRVEKAKELGMEINTSTLNNIIKGTDERWRKSVSHWQRNAAKQLANDGGLW